LSLVAIDRCFAGIVTRPGKAAAAVPAREARGDVGVSKHQPLSYELLVLKVATVFRVLIGAWISQLATPYVLPACRMADSQPQ